MTSIKLKKSSVAGKVPVDSDLAHGELAINFQDGKLFYKDASNNIKAFIDSAAVGSLITAGQGLDSAGVKTVTGQGKLTGVSGNFAVAGSSGVTAPVLNVNHSNGQANVIFTNSAGQLCFGADGSTSNITFRLDDENGQPIFRFTEENGTSIFDGGDTDVTTHKDFIFDSAGVIQFDLSDRSLKFGDNVRAKFGDGGDLQIYHSGSGSFISDAGTGNLRLGGNNISFENSSFNENMILATENQGVSLYYNGLKRLETGIDNVQVLNEDGGASKLKVSSNNNTIGTNAAAVELYANFFRKAGLSIFGDSIGASSPIEEWFIGRPYGQSAQPLHITSNTSGQKAAVFNQLGSVELYYNNAKKLETSAGGLIVSSDAITPSYSGEVEGIIIKSALADSANDENVSFRVETSPNGGTADKAFDIVQVTGGNAGGTDIEVRLGNRFTNATKPSEIVLKSDDASISADILSIPDGTSTTNRISVGDSNDFVIFHNGSNSFLRDQGTGALFVQSSRFIVEDLSSNRQIDVRPAAQVEINYNGNKKFETLDSGVNITGNLRVNNAPFSSGIDSNAVTSLIDSAYVLSRGSATIKVLQDDSSLSHFQGISFAPVVTDGEVLLQPKISVLDSAGTENLLDINFAGGGGVDSAATIAIVNNALLSADSATFNQISIPDGAALGATNRINVGSSDDLKIYHDGLNSHIAEGGTGDLNISGTNNIIFKSSPTGEFYAIFRNNGAAELYHNNNKRIETTDSGATITGSITADSATINDGSIFFDSAGNSQRLQLSHTLRQQSDVLLVQTATGFIRIGSQNSQYAHFETDRPRFYFGQQIMTNGTITSYINDLQLQSKQVTKITLTDSGATVAGRLRADSATISGLKLPTADGSVNQAILTCLLYTSPSPRDPSISRMPSSA